MKLSIIILTYKSRGLLRQCLKGIKKFETSFNYEIIVVDNASGNGTVEMIKTEFPEVKIIANDKNLGHPRGVNQGLKEARGEYVLILNPDIVFLDEAIEKMVEFMDTHSEIGVVGPRLINPDKTTQLICRRFTSFFTPFYRRTFLGKTQKGQKYLTYYLMKDYNHQESCVVPWIQGSCMMARRKAVDEVGLLDERFYLYLADEDWCRRFWLKGWQVYYLASVKIVHYYHRESAENSLFDSFFNYVSRNHILDWLKYLKKYHKAREDALCFRL